MSRRREFRRVVHFESEHNSLTYLTPSQFLAVAQSHHIVDLAKQITKFTVETKVYTIMSDLLFQVTDN